MDLRILLLLNRTTILRQHLVNKFEGLKVRSSTLRLHVSL